MRIGRALAAVGGGALVLLVGGVAATPFLVRALLDRRGMAVEAAGWSGEGLWLHGIVWGTSARATAVRVGWDRTVRVQDAHVGLDLVDAVRGGGPFLDDGPSLREAVLPFVRSVQADGLQVDGAPLPTLSGTLWPERHLEGDGVRIDGDTVHATVTTPIGSVALDVRPDGGAYLVDATCAACTLPAPSAADAPVPISGAAVHGRWADDTFTGSATLGDVHATFTAHRAEAGLTADVTLPPTPIAALYAALGPLVPEVARATIGGTVSGTAKVAWPGGIRDVTPTIDGFTVQGLVSPSLAEGPFVFRARDAAGEEAIVTSGEGSPDWLPLAAMGRWLPAAVIAAEDSTFATHPGYDLDGMREAAAANAEAGGIVRGGSTLTQQLAKNLFLDGTRSYGRKLRELLYAVDLEQHLGKHRILELYLNVVEFGPGIHGARAAARTYFLKEPAGLLPEEAAWLASILRNPRTAWHTQYEAGKPDTARVQWILGNLRNVPEAERVAALGRAVRLVPP